MTDTTPKHPGKILFDQVMTPLGVSRNKLARDIDVPVGRISDIVAGKRGVTPDTALRFAKYFGTTAELWLRLQADYDLFVARTTTWREAEPKVAEFEPVTNSATPSASASSRETETDNGAEQASGNYPREVDMPAADEDVHRTDAPAEVVDVVGDTSANDQFENPLSTVRPDDEDIDIPEPLTAGINRPKAG